MARPLRIEYPGAFHHVTSRGNERKAVFKSRRDREKFLEYLESASEDFILGYFAGTHSVAQQEYRSFVRSLIGKEYRSP